MNTSRGRAGNEATTPAGLAGEEQKRSTPLKQIVADTHAFPALGAACKPLQAANSTADAARKEDTSKVGGVAPIKGFSWASVVTEKTTAAPAARVPAPAQASLLTAALAGPPVTEPQVQFLCMCLSTEPMVLHVYRYLPWKALDVCIHLIPPSLQQKPSNGADVPLNEASIGARNGMDGGTVSLDHRPPDVAISSSAAAGRHSQHSSGHTPQGNSHAASSQTRQQSGGKRPSAVHNSVRMPSWPRDRQGSIDDGLSKGTFRGSPVTDLQLASDVNRNTVRALRTMGPSDFQAVREIGQGAFGKVCSSLFAINTAPLPGSHGSCCCWQ